MNIKLGLSLTDLDRIIYAFREFYLADEKDLGNKYLLAYLEQTRRIAERSNDEIDIDNIPF